VWWLLVASVVLWLLSSPLLRNSRLRSVPGPRSYAYSSIPLAWNAWQARSIHRIQQLHAKFGPVVRVKPDQISFNSLSALRTIYGAGSSFERTDFYSMFNAFGKPNMFTFASGALHRDRKKLLSHMYSNQTVLGLHYSQLVLNKVAAFLNLLESEPQKASEIFSSLHYFSLDAISEFVYGPDHGGTRALKGSESDRDMISDILDPARRRLSWFLVHFPAVTKWLITRTGVLEQLIAKMGLLPMNKPFTYSGIRQHALNVFHSFNAAPIEEQQRQANTTVIGRLFRVREKQGLDNMDIASECADHLLAGIDTTSDSLMFVIWALSLPKNEACQSKLRDEVSRISVNEQGLPEPKDLMRLPYLNAVMRESLRLYAPLPSFEPRTCPTDQVVDGYDIPAGTIVGMSPWCLHRDPSVYPEPLTFKPERWLSDDGTLLPESDDKNRFFWAFSSGGRMCIGMHLANAEMLTLTAALYRKYKTSARRPDTSPGITSRFEIFGDDTMSHIEEHHCEIDFIPLKQN
jgi:cytochrome P450